MKDGREINWYIIESDMNLKNLSYEFYMIKHEVSHVINNLRYKRSHESYKLSYLSDSEHIF